MTTAGRVTPTTEFGQQRVHRRPTAVLAHILDITQGQAATAILALAVSVVLTLGGLSPVLRNRNAGEAGAAGMVQPAPSRTASDATAGSPASPEVATPVESGERSLPAPATGPSRDTGATDAESPPSAELDTPGGSSRFAGPDTGETVRFASVGSPGTPDGVAVAEDGAVYVATNNGSSQGEPGPSRVLAFEADGGAGRTYTITGQPEDHALGLTGLALDGTGGLLTLDTSTASVLRIELATGRQTTYSELIDLPGCGLVVAAPSGCEPGLVDEVPEPRSAALDASGNLYVTDATQGTVWRVPSGGGDPEPWLTSNIFGRSNGLSGVVIDVSGAVLVASPESLDPAAAFAGAIYRVPVDGAGRAGTPELVVSFAVGEEPAGVVVRTDGSIIAALRGANAVVLIGPDGAEVRRVAGGSGDDALDAPTGVAFHAETVLVTNQAPANRAAWAVLAVGIGT